MFSKTEREISGQNAMELLGSKLLSVRDTDVYCVLSANGWITA
jgi:hypothetical protein